jgi:hypothetical protein
MALMQSHFRFGLPELTEQTHGWVTGEDMNAYMPSARPFLLRFAVQADATGLNNVDSEFQFRLNGGAWTNITATSAVVRTGSTTVFTNGQDCTKRLGGTGTFVVNNDGCTHDGTSGGVNNDVPAGGNYETEIGIQALAADTVLGDVIELRLTRDGGILLDSYAVTPRVTVAAEIFPVALRQSGVLGPAERAVPAGAAGKLWHVEVDMAQADLENPAVRFDLRMYTQRADLTWPTPDWAGHNEDVGCTFTGGPNLGRNGTPTGRPYFDDNGNDSAGRNVRFYLNNLGVAFAAGLLAAPAING